MCYNLRHMLKMVDGGVCGAKGFRAAGVEAAVKHPGRKDVGLIAADAPCAAAAVFTTNKVAAAPVLYCRQAVKSGRAQAIVANSGCANACTGGQGERDARLTALLAAGELGIDPSLVLVASTGVIGRPMPMDRIAQGVALAARSLKRTKDAALDFEKAIMTTDTRPKQACARFSIGGKTATIGACVKGSGMIEPNMATMLAFIATDAAVSPAMLKRALRLAVEKSFNRLVVDGDESTNDSAFILASGLAGNKTVERAGEDFDAFREALEAVCVSLVRQMARDGEGATKFVEVRVSGAKTRRDAEKAARAIARSPLAKTSWFGRDPNWGRVLAAAGYSGAEVDAKKAIVSYGGEWAYRRGEVAGEDQLAKLEKALEGDELLVEVDLGLGRGEETIYTCDLTEDYIHINADYTT